VPVGGGEKRLEERKRKKEMATPSSPSLRPPPCPGRKGLEKGGEGGPIVSEPLERKNGRRKKGTVAPQQKNERKKRKGGRVRAPRPRFRAGEERKEKKKAGKGKKKSANVNSVSTRGGRRRNPLFCVEVRERKKKSSPFYLPKKKTKKGKRGRGSKGPRARRPGRA